jgi:hypothetical protein
MVVAEKLGKTLNQLRENMTREELILWSMFYELRREEEQKTVNKAKSARR